MIGSEEESSSGSDSEDDKTIRSRIPQLANISSGFSTKEKDKKSHRSAMNSLDYNPTSMQKSKEPVKEWISSIPKRTLEHQWGKERTRRHYEKE